MCGRFVVSVPDLAELAQALGVVVDRSGVWLPHFNIAPTDLAPVVTNEPERALAQMHFGLQPFWAKGAASSATDEAKTNAKRKSASLINARVETIATKSAYKKALENRRCIIPVSGYYEWQKVGGKKQPLFIHAKDGKFIPLSGVWERWTTRDGEVIESFAIVTRSAAGFMAGIHDRMPLEVPKEAIDLWLDPKPKTAEELAPVLKAESGADHLDAYPVSTEVNTVANDTPDLIKRVEPKQSPQLDLFGAKPPRR
jgi:putative SOS response-associated peptidase YedK